MEINRQEADLHILQVSDCHLYADPAGSLLGLNTLDSLRQVLIEACAETSPDLILVTGDLVHDGSTAGYQTLSSLLLDTGHPSAVIPGNHDHIPNMQQVLDSHGIPSSGYLNLGNWRLVLLNSQVAGKEHGHLSARELELLDRALENPPPNLLVILHHQPTPVSSQWLDNIGLDNGRQLLSRLAKEKAVKAVVWGHIHQTWEGKAGHIQLLATPSTCIQFAPKNDQFGLDRQAPGWRWLTLGKNGNLSSEVKHLMHMPAGLDMDSAGY
jgi:Icc protein